MEKLKIYLYGRRFTVITDCKALIYLFNKVQSKPSARIERWILRLQEFDFEVKYEPGDQNVADALSRLLADQKKINTEPDVLAAVIEDMKPSKVTLKDIEEATHDDLDLQAVKSGILFGDWSDVPAEFRSESVRNELITNGKIIMRGHRIVIPKKLQKVIVKAAHKGHQGVTSMKFHLRSRVWFPKMDLLIEQESKDCKGCVQMTLPDKPGPISRRLPNAPWQDLALDFKEGLPGGESMLVVVCYMTRFTQIEHMNNPTSSKVIYLKKKKSFFCP